MKLRGKILVKIIVSYSAIIGIAIAASMILSFATYRNVKELSDFQNENLVNVIKGVYDSEIGHYKNFLEKLKLEYTVQSFSRNTSEYTMGDYWNDYQLRFTMEDFYKDMNKGNACYNLFVWSNRQEKMITQSSVLTYTQYKLLVCNENSEWSGQLRQSMNQLDKSRAIGLNSEEKDYIVLLEPVTGVGIEKGDAVMGAWIDTNSLDVKINTVDWSTGMDWMLMDNQGNIVRHPRQLPISREKAVELLKMEGSKITIEGDTYLCCVQQSEFFGMKYVLFMPENMVNASVNQIRLISFLCLIMILVAGVLLTKRFVKMHYYPLKGLVEQLQSDKANEQIGSEYEFLKKSVLDIMNKNQIVENKNQKLLYNRALEKLLLGWETRTDDPESYAKVYEKFNRGMNLVLVCCEKEVDRDKNTEIIMEEWLRLAVIANVFEEGLGEYFERETFVYNDKVVSIVNIPSGVGEYAGMLREEIEKVREFIDMHFQISFYTLQGGTYDGIAGVSQSWSEACSCMEFADALDEMYVEYDEMRDLTTYSYVYSFDIEQCIVKAVKSGDTDTAKTLVDGVLDKCFDKTNNTHPDIRTCMLYDIYGTLVKVSEEQGIQISRIPQTKWLYAGKGCSELKEYFHQVLEEIGECLKKQQKHEIAEQVLDYIKSHYMDPDLNISQIAYHFRVKPAWISGVFKKATGRSMLEVIRKIRVEKAQQLLSEGVSVLEVSRRVGFQDTTTFIRVFKSLVGVTPGQMKKN